MTIYRVFCQGTGHDSIQDVLTVRELDMTIYRMFFQGTGHDNIKDVLSGNWA